MPTPGPQNLGTENGTATQAADPAHVTQASMIQPAPAITPNAPTSSLAQQPNAPTPNQVAWGKWLYKHRDATEGVGGFLGYQIVRNALAAVPYGIATAGVWLGMEKYAQHATLKANPGMQLGETPKIVPHSAQLMRSPLRDVAMIAAGFTLFRGTLKVVRYMKERLFDPKHTEEQAIQEAQNFTTNLKDTFNEVSPAEIASTPAAAIALGIGRRFWDAPSYLGNNAKTHKVTGVFLKGFDKEKRWERVKNVFSRKGGYFAEAGIVATSFVPFFELGDRRYKDAQVARGIWLNDPTSLMRKSDEQVKAELAQGQAYIGASNDNASNDNLNTDPNSAIKNAMARKSAESLHATGHLRPTDSPSISCFAMRRVVPTFLGIGAYVAGKRLAYLGMGTIPENYNANKKGFGGFLANLGRIALIEGAATSLFWLNSSVIDKYEPWYDKTFKDDAAKPLTNQEVRKHYLELQARLDAKELDRKGGVSSVG